MAVLPLLGILLFFLIGSPKLPQRRREKQQDMDRLIEEAARAVGPVRPGEDAPAWFPSVSALVDRVGAMPLLQDNDARMVMGFDEQLRTLVQAIDSAERYVHSEFYITIRDTTTEPFFDALRRAVERGVTVRLLLDHMGTRPYPGYRKTLKALTAMGVQWHLMLPVQPLKGRWQRPDLRNHRKLLVADGDVGFVGSLNMIDPSYDKRGNKRRGLQWVDELCEVHGPVVHEIDALFVTDWFCETDELLDSSREQASDEQRGGTLLAQVAPSGPAYDQENNLALFNSLLYHAERRISITSPYFVPEQSLLGAITTAARRGVDVELFVGEIGDQFMVFHAQHSYYSELLSAGVKIYLYPAPHILHSKHVSVDDQVAVIGSSNMDIRSFQLDLEVMLMVCGRTFVDQVKAVEDEYRRLSKPLQLVDWERRGFWRSVIDNVMRLTSAVQ
ncbi:cardiolipin synthetase 2 [Microlunatus sagamiharensis]|uniref:Cardiolipin synthase n=1 Tax=Microlunatus sagamiharensis TaxID=546874 RepID=A0A1H2NDF3_9ACTN|nr:cardiolipin synthase [Microlunatus sagamiharensis]SDV03497.1 cardiolipin synthetase 2 [Microlunatus sagamiharensis]